MTDIAQKPQEKTLASEVRGMVERPTLPTNPKRVIRTFASDVAALTGAPESIAPTPPPKPEPVQTPVPVALKTPVQTPPPAVKSLATAVSEIDIPEEVGVPRLPPLQKQGVRTPSFATPKPIEARPTPSPTAVQPREWERIVQKRELSFVDKLFMLIFGVRTNAPATKKPLPTTPTWHAPRASEPAAEVGAPSLKSPTAIADELREREEILSRLRTRVETYQATRPLPPPVFPAPRPEYQASRPTPVPPAPMQTSAQKEPERLRTYTDDFSSRIDTKQASAFSIYAAQADAGKGMVAATPEPTTSHRGLAYALGSTVLIVGGSLALYYGYTSFSVTLPVPVISTTPPTVIGGDDYITIAGEGKTLLASLAQAATISIPIGTVRIVYLATQATSTNSGGTLIKTLALPAPDILLRNIGDESTVGVVHAGEHTAPFFIFAARSYERTFAGMLSWEATIARDLAPLYPPHPAITATTTATTTAQTPVRFPIPQKPRFVDRVVDSHDVRVLIDTDGRTVLLYGYRDQKTLIIARDETAFSVLLARLSATRAE